MQFERGLTELSPTVQPSHVRHSPATCGLLDRRGYRLREAMLNRRMVKQNDLIRVEELQPRARCSPEGMEILQGEVCQNLTDQFRRKRIKQSHSLRLRGPGGVCLPEALVYRDAREKGGTRSGRRRDEIMGASYGLVGGEDRRGERRTELEDAGVCSCLIPKPPSFLFENSLKLHPGVCGQHALDTSLHPSRD